MTHQPLDPRICPIAIDANTLNRDKSFRDSLVDRLLELSSARAINLIVPQGVRLEIRDPRTPDHIQKAALPLIFTTPIGLTADEQEKLRLIEATLQGNARSGRHAADARHLFEAAKYGGYFITHDQRILKRAGNLRTVLPPSLSVVTLRRFLEIYDSFVSKRGL